MHFFPDTLRGVAVIGVSAARTGTLTLHTDRASQQDPRFTAMTSGTKAEGKAWVTRGQGPTKARPRGGSQAEACGDERS